MNLTLDCRSYSRGDRAINTNVTIPDVSGTGPCTPASLISRAFGAQRRGLKLEIAMKIYLLMLLIGVLLIAIHFTAPSQKPSKASPQ
jgi:hypothetical protein